MKQMAQTPTNQAVRSIARRASAAILRRRFIESLSMTLLWALGAALGVISIARLLGTPLGIWWAVPIAAIVIAATISGLMVLRARLSEAQGAGFVDERLHLDSQLRSALELETDQAITSPGFVQLAQRRAATLAGQATLEGALPRVDAQRWWWSGLIVALAITAGIWLPMRSPGPSPRPRQVPTGAIASIDSARESLGDDELQGEPEPESVQQAMSELEALKQELSQGVENQEEASAQTASRLQKLADTLEDEAEQSQRRAQELANRIAEAQNRADQSPDHQWDPRIDEFAQSIKEQRYDDAAGILDKLHQQAGELSDAQRQAMAEQLEQLADAVEPDPVDEQPPPPETQEQSQRSPPAGEPPPPQEKQDQQNQGERGERHRDELSQSLRDEAQKMREGQPRDQQQPQERGESNEQQSPKQQEQEGDPRQNQTDQDQSQQPQRQPGDQSQSEQEQQQQQGEPQQEREPGESGTQEQSQQQNPADAQGQEPAQRPQQGGRERAQNQPGTEGQQQEPPTQSPGGDQQPQPHSLDEQLENMQSQQRRAQRNRERAQEIREQAQRLIDPSPTPSPEDQQPGGAQRDPRTPPRSEGGAGDGPRDPSVTPGARDPDDISNFVPVDGAGDQPGGSGDPVGKWYAPEGEAPARGDAKEAAERLHQAAQQAQRAVDQQQVPRKYRHVVREVFKRVEQRAGELGSTGRIAPQGKDAVPSGAWDAASDAKE